MRIVCHPIAQDFEYKYVISTRIWNVDDKGNKVFLGVLAAGIPIDHRMMVLDQLPASASVVCSVDWSYPKESDLPPEHRDHYVAALHRDNSKPGLDPKWFDPKQYPHLEHLSPQGDGEDDLAEVGRYVRYHRVRDSDFVVVIERLIPGRSESS